MAKLTWFVLLAASATFLAGQDVAPVPPTPSGSPLTLDQQFWWNWWVSAIEAIATVAAVIVALFGRWLAAHIFPPTAVLVPRANGGELTFETIRLQDGTYAKVDDAWYYHLRFKNRRNWGSIRAVQVFLILLEEQRPHGKNVEIWSGDTPMRWKHQEIYPKIRSIGGYADLDLCRVLKGGQCLQILPILKPNNLKVEWSGPCSIIAYFQARSRSKDFPIVAFRIAWDGRWSEGKKEMSDGLTIEEHPVEGDKVFL